MCAAAESRYLSHTRIRPFSKDFTVIRMFFQVVQTARSDARHAACLAEFLARHTRMICCGSSVMLATRVIVLMDGLLTVGLPRSDTDCVYMPSCARTHIHYAPSRMQRIGAWCSRPS